VNGFAPASQFKGAVERPSKVLADKPELLALSKGLMFSGLYAGASASDLTLASGCAKFSGISVV
jgi:hypothetical protein